MFFNHVTARPPVFVQGGRCKAIVSNVGPSMKTLLLLLLMSSIVTIAYLAVPARPAAEPEAGQ
jgi:hypothetical protein